MNNDSTSPTGEVKPSGSESTDGSESTMSDTKFFEAEAEKQAKLMQEREKLAKKK